MHEAYHDHVTINLARWLSFDDEFDNLNARCHIGVYMHIKFKLVILNLVTSKKFAKSPN